MKKFRHLMIMLLAFSTVIVSCSDDDDNNNNNNNNNPNSIIGKLQADPEMSVFVSALQRANLVTTLNATGPFTVFAPENSAFNLYLQENGFANVDAVPVATLRQLLQNHIISGNHSSSSLTTGYMKTNATGMASSTNTLSIFINTVNGVMLNGGPSNGGATVIDADQSASNGVIHTVNSVIELPSIVNHAIANPDLGILVSAMTRPDQPDFATILSGNGPFTVFAPDNDAFVELMLAQSWTSIDDAPQSLLENTLKYHVVQGANALSTSLTNNQVVSSFQGASFTIELPASGPRIMDMSGNMSNITSVDIQGTNGVIHILDRVLMLQ